MAKIWLKIWLKAKENGTKKKIKLAKMVVKEKKNPSANPAQPPDHQSDAHPTEPSRPACAAMQSDQGRHCPLTESLDTTDCITRDQRPGCYVAHVQDDTNLHMFEDTFSHDVAKIV